MALEDRDDTNNRKVPTARLIRSARTCLLAIDNRVSQYGSKSDGFLQTGIILFLLVWVFYYLRFDAEAFSRLTNKSLSYVLIVTLIAIPCRARTLPPPFRCVLIAINACCVFFLYTSRETYSIGSTSPILNSAWLPITLGFLAFRFPALVAWPALCIQWSKLSAATEAGWGSLNGADYIIIPDLALLLVLMIGGYVVYNAVSGAVKAPRYLPFVDSSTFFSAAVLALAAVHLSNYFYSGLGKLHLPNAGILTWVMENKTYILSANATEAHFFTLQNILNSYSDQIYFILRLFNVPMNFMVLLGQLVALTCLLSLRKAALITAFYDIMHVAIFVLTGIFFWKWIVLNAAFIYAFRSIRQTLAIPISFRIFVAY